MNSPKGDLDAGVPQEVVEAAEQVNQLKFRGYGTATTKILALAILRHPRHPPTSLPHNLAVR